MASLNLKVIFCLPAGSGERDCDIFKVSEFLKWSRSCTFFFGFYTKSAVNCNFALNIEDHLSHDAYAENHDTYSVNHV